MSTHRVSRAARNARAAYNTLLVAATPALGAYTLWRRFGAKRSAESVRGLWGEVPAAAREKLSTQKPSSTQESAPVLWIHAVSVGETMAARVVARALRKRLPHARLALSTTTDTGQHAARAAMEAGEVDAVFYFPMDSLIAVRRALQAVRPAAVLILETELWPNFLHEAKAAGAKTFLVNGRVSDNLLRRAPRMGRLWRWMMENLDGLLMRSEFDAMRMKKLGAPSTQVVVTGDVKLDALPTDEENQAARNQWRDVLQLNNNDLLLVAGSTHPGEEEMVLRVWEKLRAEFADLRVLAAPRHIERRDEVLALARRFDEKAQLRSQLADEKSLVDEKPKIVVLDTVGELAQIYAAADVAFVGGSLIERGGHNLLEPVLRGVPVTFGPHVMNFRDAARWATENEIGTQVEDENALLAALQNWLSDENQRREKAAGAREKLRANSGAAERVADIVAATLRVL